MVGSPSSTRNSRAPERRGDHYRGHAVELYTTESDTPWEPVAGELPGGATLYTDTSTSVDMTTSISEQPAGDDE